MRAFSSRYASGSLVGFSASSDDDDEKSHSTISEIVPKASSERSRKTSLSELIGLSVFVSRISERYKKKKKVRARSRGSSGSRRRAMMMKNRYIHF